MIREREQIKGIRVIVQIGNATIRGKIEVTNGTLPPDARFHIWARRTDGAPNVINNVNNIPQIDTRGQFVQKGSNTSGLLLGALRTPPSFNNLPYLDPTTKLHRSYRFPHPGFSSLQTGRGYDNPFFVMNNPGNNSELGRFIGNVNADWTPLE